MGNRFAVILISHIGSQVVERIICLRCVLDDFAGGLTVFFLVL